MDSAMRRILSIIGAYLAASYAAAVVASFFLVLGAINGKQVLSDAGVKGSLEAGRVL